MLCQECHEFPATILFTHFVNGEKQHIRVCKQCAYQFRNQRDNEDQVSIHDLLKELFDVHAPRQVDESSQQQSLGAQGLACNHCGLSLREFRNNGKLGCHECYQSFAKHLDPILNKVHTGHTRHIGKVPSRNASAVLQVKELEQLRTSLQVCIQEENFEEAAIIRDKIKQLEGKINHQNEGGEDQ